MAGATLWATRFKGKIEGRDPGDGAEWKPFYDAPTPGGRLLPIQRQIFAIGTNCLLSRDVESKDSAVNFAASALDGLARFQCDGVGELLFTIANAGRNLAQNPLTFEGGQSPCGSERLDRGGYGSVRVFAASLVDVGDQRAVVRRVYVDDVTLFQPLPVQKKSVGCNRSYRHFSHASTSLDDARGSSCDRAQTIIELHEERAIINARNLRRF